ncbi:hypothetical protein PGTUg99_013204 [Puccinia graminis f. sp. tritici]|uniref:RING-type domain-containing protein n=1 Tax=Puccinia graminis f. sp. tritici TaxID=56615 RepID=A0A5B0SKT6_PUCGR|nr:hypothetical protein PGTUg99_013204 [Puccinia graminis f. sp. tritici]
MLLLVQILWLVVLFQVSTLFSYGLPSGPGATSSSGNWKKLRQSYKSLKRKCSLKSGLSGSRRFDSSSLNPTAGPESMPVCYICSATILPRQDMFMFPNCGEGHTIHQGCVDAQYFGGSSCPICQAVSSSIQQHELVAPSSSIAQVKDQQMSESQEADGCPLCLEEWSQEDVRLEWPICSHFFHQTCVEPWRRSHVTCPVCRREDPELILERSNRPGLVETTPQPDVSYLLDQDSSYHMATHSSYPVARDSSYQMARHSSYPVARDSSYHMARHSSYPVARDSSYHMTRHSSYPVAEDSSYHGARDSSYHVARGSSYDVAEDYFMDRSREIVRTLRNARCVEEYEGHEQHTFSPFLLMFSFGLVFCCVHFL